MIENIKEISLRKVAVIAGASIVIMAVLAGFVYGYVFSSLVVKGDAVVTANNIIASQGLFRMSVYGWVLILVLDIVAAWALYLFFKPVSKSLSLLSAMLRFVYAGILGAALLDFVVVLQLLSEADYLKVFEPTQLHSLVLLFINTFEGIWAIGLVVFGLHLLTLGYLSYKSGFAPKAIGVLLILGAIGYFATNSVSILLSNYESYRATVEMIFILPMVFGELSLGLWLLIKGGKNQS